MFQKARLKLTLWYLAIIMAVSLSFSMAIYRAATGELDRIEHLQKARLERNFFLSLPQGTFGTSRYFLDQDIIDETRSRLLLILIIINASILGFSTLAGYFLAGRTLEPIRNMVAEQNRFVTDASHELRTPLTALKSGIEVNLRNKNLALSEAKNLLKSNLEEVNSLQELSDRLIKLSRFAADGQSFPMSVTALEGSIREAVRKISPMAKNKKISLTPKLSGASVCGNAAALTELFVILLDNAVKYSPVHTKIQIVSRRTDGHVTIDVIDQGIGIDSADTPHLFDRFYRSDKSRTKAETPGYGLGLSIAKQIAEQHHGAVTVQSQLGKGSTFTVKLPTA